MGQPGNQNAASAGIDEADLRAWLVEYGPALRRFFARRVGAAEADDLVQDVFVHLQSRAKGAAVEDVERYLFRTANNVLISRQRRLAVRSRALDEVLHDKRQPTESISSERILIGKQEIARAIEAMRKLPPRTREAFIFHRFNEMTYPAIAERMGISVSAVGQLIARALEKLAEETRQP